MVIGSPKWMIQLYNPSVNGFLWMVYIKYKPPYPDIFYIDEKMDDN